MQCNVCGADYDPGDCFCRCCGVRIAKPAEPTAGIVSEEPAPVSPMVRRTRLMLRIVSILLIVMAVFTLILVQVAPDLLKSVGMGPKNLGVKWSNEDYLSILKKSGVRADEPPDGTDRSAYTDVYSGKKDVDWTFTESEITAWFNEEAQPGYWPFSDVQFRIQPDNVFEASFSLDPKKVMTFPIVTKYLPKEITSFISRIPLQFPMYAKAKITFNGSKQANVQMQAFDASGISAADIALSEEANQIIEGMLDDIFSRIDPVSITAFTTSEGALHIQGTWYEEIKRVPNQ